jgi:membrane protease YdiL (CAAX protease family)
VDSEDGLADSRIVVPHTPAFETRLERFTSSDIRVLVLWILAGIFATGVAWRYFYKALPEASVDFTISRDQALELARQFAASQNAQLSGYQSSVIFAVDEDAKTYLERTVGLEQANNLMSTRVNAWYWRIRFFRPQQKEEYRLRVSPAGKVVGYEHIVEESRTGPHMEHDAAFARATQFLHNNFHTDLDTYKFLPEEANSTELPARRDWSFSWERNNFRVPDNSAGATYRLTVGVQGDAVGLAIEFLKVPEAWNRDYAKLRSGNDLLETIAIIPYCLIYGAAFWVIFELSKLGLMRWGAPVKIGLALAALWLLNSVNSWPSLRADYNTNDSYSAFFFNQLMFAALLSVFQGLLVTLALAPGEPMYRLTQPDRLQLKFALRWPGLRSKEFFNAGVIGLSLAAVHIGYVVVFYLVAQHFGAWAPQDVNYAGAVSTNLPWLEAMVIGFFAATSEEFLFRLFAIPFVKRITKSQFLAVVLPAFAWGFLHSNYPQEPAYIRGIEIGLIGIVAGLVMLRWGILATLIWHYTVDATLGSLLLLKATSPYLRFSGAIVSGLALFPLAFAVVMYVMRGGFEVREGTLNRAEPLVAPAAEQAAVERPRVAGYQAMTARAMLTLAICGATGVVLFFAVRQEQIGTFVHYQIDAQQAATRADSALRDVQVDPARYHRALVISDCDASDDPSVSPPVTPVITKFLVDKIGIDGTNRVYERRIPLACWRARYFRDTEPEEFFVLLQTDGSLFSVWHKLDDRAAGVNLTKDQAQQIAETWLAKFKQLDLAQWRLVGADSSKRVNRTDHSFTWEDKTAIAGDSTPEDSAFVRVSLQVLGAEVSGFRSFVKIPEVFVQRQDRRTLAATLLGAWKWGLISLLAILVIVFFFKDFKTASAIVPWRKLSRWAAIPTVAFLAWQFTAYSSLLSNYDTRIPFKAFVATVSIGLLLGMFLLFGMVTLLFGLAYVFLTQAGFAAEIPQWLGMPRAYYRDAIVCAIAGAAALVGVSRIQYLISQVWHVQTRGIGAAVPSGFDTVPPAGQALAQSIFTAFTILVVLAAAAGFIARYVRPAWTRVLLFLGLVLSQVGSPVSAGQFLQQLLLQSFFLAVVWWGVSRFIRLNLLGYFLLLAGSSLLQSAVNLIAQPNSYLRANGGATLAMLALLLLWPLMAWLRTTDRSEPPEAMPIVSEGSA